MQAIVQHAEWSAETRPASAPTAERIPSCSALFRVVDRCQGATIVPSRVRRRHGRTLEYEQVSCGGSWKLFNQIRQVVACRDHRHWRLGATASVTKLPETSGQRMNKDIPNGSDRGRPPGIAWEMRRQSGQPSVRERAAIPAEFHERLHLLTSGGAHNRRTGPASGMRS